MAHNTINSGYSRLRDRLNRYPQGAPPSELLFKILKMLFSEPEAHRVKINPGLWDSRKRDEIRHYYPVGALA